MFNAYETMTYIKNNLTSFILDWRKVKDPELKRKIKEYWTQDDPKKGSILSRLLIENNYPYSSSDKSIENYENINEIKSLIDHFNFLMRIINSEKLPKLPGGDIPFGGQSELQERLLHSIKDSFFPTDRNLYEHQNHALLESIENGKNLIISSGTGSGKTESFLLPTIARLLNESDEERSKPGVRVIILYPMNALINNQVKRLQGWLGAQDPDRVPIRFGLYTSKLKKDLNRKNTYRNQHEPYCEWPDHQIIDRKELRRNPPHILVTNYSMLEYALVRPDDLPLFSEDRQKLHTLIIDEAHSYIGALAAEITLLIRRLLIAFNKTSDEINFFATSATIGDPDKDGGKALQEYAADLFSTEKDSVSVILGKRNIPEAINEKKYDISDILNAIQEWNGNTENDLSRYLPEYRENDSLETNLYEILRSTKETDLLRDSLYKSPQYIDDCLKALGLPLNQSNLSSLSILLDLYSRARKEQAGIPLLPVRLHLVASAPDGVWICSDCQNIMPHQHELCPKCGKARIGELVVCKQCGDPLIAFDDNEDSPPVWQWQQGTRVKLETFAGKSVSNDACENCGKKSSDLVSRNLENQSEEIRLDETRELFKSYFFQTFNISHHLIQQTLIDNLYDKLEPLNKQNLVLPGGGRRLLTFTDSRQKAAKLASRLEWTHDNILGRRLILEGIGRAKKNDDQIGIFEQFLSDSEWTPFFEIMKRRHNDKILTLSALNHCQTKCEIEEAISSVMPPDSPLYNPMAGFAFEDLVSDFYNFISSMSMDLNPGIKWLDAIGSIAKLPELPQLTSFWDKINSADHYRRQYIAHHLLLREFSMLPTHGTQLETMGLVALKYDGLDEAFKDFSFGSVKGEDLYPLAEAIFNRMRQYGATSNQNPDENDEDFNLFSYSNRPQYLNRAFSLRNSGELIRSERILPKDPTALKENAFIRIAKKLCDSHGWEDVNIQELIANFWLHLVHQLTGTLFQKNEESSGEIHVGLDLKYTSLILYPETFRCETCGNRSPYHLNGYCSIHHCPGTVETVPKDTLENSYSYNRTSSGEVLGMRTTEHTAQIDLNQLTNNEYSFTNGEVNILSSSTTMELGIDIGGLTAVYLSNCPPGPANYLQRAGRAGRRADSSSIVVTNARDLPLDKYFFNKPNLFFVRKPHDPYVSLGSTKIVSRHLNAFLLAQFFETYRNVVSNHYNPLNSFGSVGAFFTKECEIDGSFIQLADEFIEWLVDIPGYTKEMCQSIVYNSPLAMFNMDEYTDELRNRFISLSNRINSYVANIERDIVESEREGLTRKVKSLTITKSIFENKSLIEYLAEKQVLPKYGFPISLSKLNSMNMESQKDSEKAIEKSLQRLERPLDRAIHEYAPGSSVVVNKRLLTSRGISLSEMGAFYVKGEKGIESKRYFTCENCGHFHVIDEYGVNEDCCPVCGATVLTVNTDFDFGENDAESTTQNIKIREAIEPKGFSVDFYEKQPYSKSLDPHEHVKIIIKSSIETPEEEFSPTMNGYLSFHVQDNASFHSINEGHGTGYAICRSCGRTVVEGDVLGVNKIVKAHKHLNGWRRGGETNCTGPNENNFWRKKSLIASYSTDAIQIRLNKEFSPTKGKLRKDQIVFFNSLGRALVLASSKILGIDERELAFLLNPYKNKERVESYEIVIYDNVPGGAGYSNLIGDELIKPYLFQQALDILDCKESCKYACSNCIATFERNDEENLKYDRNSVLGFFNVPVRKAIFNDFQNQIRANQENTQIIPNPFLRIKKDLSRKDLHEISFFLDNIDSPILRPNGVLRDLIRRASSGVSVNLVFKDDCLSNYSDSIVKERLRLATMESENIHLYYFSGKDRPIIAELIFNDFKAVYEISDFFFDESIELKYSVDSKIPLLRREDRECRSQFIGNLKEIVLGSNNARVMEIKASQPPQESITQLIRRVAQIPDSTVIKEVHYSDRYFRSIKQAACLFKILEGFQYHDESEIHLYTLPIRRNNRNPWGEFGSKADQLQALKKIGEELGFGETCLYHSISKGTHPGSQHSREFLFIDIDGNEYRLFSETGLDIYTPFIPKDWDFMLKTLTKFRWNDSIIFPGSKIQNSLTNRLVSRAKDAFKSHILIKC